MKLAHSQILPKKGQSERGYAGGKEVVTRSPRAQPARGQQQGAPL